MTNKCILYLVITNKIVFFIYFNIYLDIRIAIVDIFIDNNDETGKICILNAFFNNNIYIVIHI